MEGVSRVGGRSQDFGRNRCESIIKPIRLGQVSGAIFPSSSGWLPKSPWNITGHWPPLPWILPGWGPGNAPCQAQSTPGLLNLSEQRNQLGGSVCEKGKFGAIPPPRHFYALSVLASCGCHNTLPQTGWLKTQKCILSQLWRPEDQNQGVRRTGSFWRLWSSICSRPLLTSGCCWQPLAFLVLLLHNSHFCLHFHMVSWSSHSLLPWVSVSQIYLYF